MQIYKITNLVNGKIYIGQTSYKDPEERLKRHIINSTYDSNQTYLARSIRKYGSKNFKIETICSVLDKKYLCEMEIYFIALLKPELNMTLGGIGGDTSHSPNYKRAMKEYHGNRSRESYATYGMKGKNQTEYQKKNQSAYKKGYWKDNDIKRKELSDRFKGDKNPSFGKTPTNAVKIKYNGVIYPSLRAAKDATGVSVYLLKMNGERIYD